jgi:hypothetical protein
MPATTPPMLPDWALPLACSMSSHAPSFLAELYATRYSLLRHVICLNASFKKQPDWPAIARAIGEDVADPRAPGLVAAQLLKMPLNTMIEKMGPLLHLTPFVASVLRKTAQYLKPPTYRELVTLETLPDSARRIRALMKSPPLTRNQLEVYLQVDPAFVHPAIIARLEEFDDTPRFNRMVAELRQTCAPSAEEALFQALCARSRTGDPSVDQSIREVATAHYRIPTPTLRKGSSLEAISSVSALKAEGSRLRNCLGALISRKILSGEKISVVVCAQTEMVALLRPVFCGARKAWLVLEVGARANRNIDRDEQDKFISYLNSQLDEQVWRIPGEQRRGRAYRGENQTELQELFNTRLEDL